MPPAPQRPARHRPAQPGSGPPTRRPRRQRYNTVALSDDIATDHDNNDDDNEDDDVEVATSAATNDEDDDGTDRRTAGSRNTNRHRPSPLYTALPTSTSSSTVATTTAAATVVVMEVTILDFTHKRWPIVISNHHIHIHNNTNNNSSNNHAEPTVYDLKHIGATIHHIPIQQQRLIYQGRLLNDDTVSLTSLGIHKSGSIVHLFPKPRVVVVDSNHNNNNNNTGESSNSSRSSGNNNTSSTGSNINNNNNNNDSSNSNNNNDNGGAHVPVIVMDQSEVDRRSEILVLGHADYVEAVSNVKLFSLMLLIISTIELLHLLSLYIVPPQTNHTHYYSGNGDGSNGVPHVHEDDTFFNDDDDPFNNNSTAFPNSTRPSSGNSSSHNSGSSGTDTTTPGTNDIDPITVILDEWTPIKYVDLIISVCGIYVSILGMRASNENCIRTARYYLIGTTLTAVGWLAYNYVISYEIDVQVDAHPEEYYGTSENSDYTYGNPSTSDDAIAESYGSSSGSSVYNSDDSPYNQAFSAMILPGMVWGLCIFRAWQFHQVLHEAELEAAQRTNTIMSGEEEDEEAVATATTGDVELSTLSRPIDGALTNRPNQPPVTGTMA